ncbi:hypothetical protein LguiB_024483 [Lonicera macranthoides]
MRESWCNASLCALQLHKSNIQYFPVRPVYFLVSFVVLRLQLLYPSFFSSHCSYF